MCLCLEHVNKSFGKPVLRDISYTFEPGRLYVIKGVSGCGKTTLLNILGGIDSQYEGTVRWTNDRLWRNGKDPSVSYIFQKSLLLNGLSVRDNLLLIRNDPLRVEQLTEALEVQTLLDKQPSQLSGGERQRISVVRALLNDPDLILADEPTASLDGVNSEKIAALLAELRRDDRIIIVATHESCFDQLADVVLRLEYGVMKEEFSAFPSGTPALISAGTDRWKASCKAVDYPSETRKGSVAVTRFSLKRHPELLKLKTLLPLALAFVLLLVMGTLEQCFSTETIRLYSARYPMDIVHFAGESLERFEYKDQVRVYNYYMTQEDGLTALYLMPQEDSVLNVEGVLTAGIFPHNGQEVILTGAAARQLFPDRKTADCIGQTFTLCGKEWIVAAVTDDRNDFFLQNAEADYYYNYAINMVDRERRFVFIPYDTLAELLAPGEPPSDVYMCVIRGMGADPKMQELVTEALRDDFGQVHPPNQYYWQIAERQGQLAREMQAFRIAFAVVGTLVCLYLMTIIRTELFYRREELGYLQIFGLKKYEVLRMILGEHAVKALAALAAAFGLLLLLIAFYQIVVGGFVYPSLLSCGLCLGSGAMYLLCTALTTKRFLHRSVKELIA